MEETTVKAPSRESSSDVFVLNLYVAGKSLRSIAAIANLKKICEKHLAGRHRCKIIDLKENPQLAHEDNIVAIPTLIRKMPLPQHKILGDLSNTDAVLVGLGIREPALQNQAEGESHE